MNIKTNTLIDRIRGRYGAKNRRGSATLELGLVLLLLLYITFGTIDWSYYLYTKNQVQGAAREGARAAIPSGSSNADVTTAVTNVLTVAGLKSTYAVVIEPSNVSAITTGAPVKVTVNYNWNNALGLSKFSFIGGNKTVTGVAVMRKE